MIRTFPRASGFFRPQKSSVADLARVCRARTDAAEFPLAADVISEVVVYEKKELSRPFEEEVARALLTGSGIVAIRKAFSSDVIDRATAAYAEILAVERETGTAGDHFSAAGNNSRVWNSFEKLAVHDPETFLAYYSNPVVAAVSRAWLGPHYQITSQLNIVHPGGQAQQAHRDYHLGFMSTEQAAEFPAHVHKNVVPALTLQGAVAHCDMPIESGPTLYLPHSQKFDAGYVAFRTEAFQTYFNEHNAQIPLEKGDAIFFNPAVLHAAGENKSSSIDREVNLLQVSSAFGKPMEMVDRDRVVRAVYANMLTARKDENSVWTSEMESNALAAACDGYAFPTNLDIDVPDTDSIAPPSQRSLVESFLEGKRPKHELEKALDEFAQRRRTHQH